MNTQMVLLFLCKGHRVTVKEAIEGRKEGEGELFEINVGDVSGG